MDYEDYTSAAASYDRTRVPVGVEILAGCFACGPRPLGEQVILDGGCGTGNYLAALAPRVGRLHGLELNPGMLSRARRKLSPEPRVRLTRGTLLELPYADGTFDGVMCNQVVHHFGGDSRREGFPSLSRMVVEVQRVMRPGGAFVLHTCTAQQLRNGFWWADLIPEAMERAVERYAPLEQLDEMLAAAGLRPVDHVVPLHQILQGKAYADPRGPLDPAYRSGDSVWSLATPDELDHGLGRLQRMIDRGEAEEYVAARERLRERLGQVTFVYARK